MTMNFCLRNLMFTALLAGTPSLALADDGWQARIGEALGKTGSAERLKAAIAHINVAKS
jgi:hypothetical protein